MARQPVYLLILLIPSPRLELRTLAGYNVMRRMLRNTDVNSSSTPSSMSAFINTVLHWHLTPTPLWNQCYTQSTIEDLRHEQLRRRQWTNDH
jgi:hypothetical protein